MAQQHIDTTLTGDTVKEGFDKSEANFNELYPDKVASGGTTNHVYTKFAVGHGWAAATGGSGGTPANTTTLGTVKVSVGAVDPANPIAVGDNDTRMPTTDENAALVGTSGPASTTNRYVTDADARNTNSRAPSGSAGGILSGTYPNPSFAAGAVPTSTGAFQPSHSYLTNELFTANGATFRSKQAWTSGATAPDPEAGDTADYEVWAARGEAGAPAIMVAEDNFGGYVDLDVTGTKIFEDAFGGYVDLDLFPPGTGGGVGGGDADTLDGLNSTDFALAADTAIALGNKLDEGVFDDHLINTLAPQHTANQVLVTDTGERFAASMLEDVLAELKDTQGGGTGTASVYTLPFYFGGVLSATVPNADGTRPIGVSGQWTTLYIALDAASTLGSVNIQFERMTSHTPPFTWTTLVTPAQSSMNAGVSEKTFDMTTLSTALRAIAPTDRFRINVTTVGANARNLHITAKATVTG